LENLFVSKISQRYFFRESDTPLHVLAGCVRHLPFTDVLNTPLDVAACFRLLLHLQPDVNTKVSIALRHVRDQRQNISFLVTILLISMLR